MRPTRLAFILPLLLCACSTSTAPVPPLDYAQLGRINLDVKDLSFVDRGVEATPPYPIVSEQFSPTIADAVHTWASSRLQAVGVTGAGSFVVKNAYVAEQGASGDSSWFLSHGQDHKYIGHIEVEFEARGAEGYALATANATRAVSVPDNADSEEKRDAYGALLNGLMQDLNTYLEQAIHEHMQDFIVTAPVIGSKLPPLSVPEAPVVPESPGQSP
jgi:hypothetical protein